MSTPNAARKRLPVKPSIENLKKQAKRLARSGSVQLTDAQHGLAVEYGCRNWAELAHVVETMNQGADQLSDVKRTVEPLPAAVRARDVATARAILASGQFTQHDLDAGLAHAAWYGGDASDVLRVRKELFDLLLDHGADPDGQYGSAYGPIVFGTGECLDPHGLQWLIDAGADVTFPPVGTKYGNQCPLSYWLGTYVRGRNDVKHRGIEILLAHGAYVPPEVTPPILAIHRGDAKALVDLIEAERSLLRRTFTDMPYGNISLAGATLLHCAIEFGEIDCIDAILSRYRGHGDVDMNSRADVIDGVGGQTPIYHAINTNGDGNFYTLEYLVKRVGQYIDTGVRATWRSYGTPQTAPMTPLEYAEKAAREIDPKWAHYKPRVADELAILRSLDRRAGLRGACERGDVSAAARMLDESPDLLTPELWPPAIFRAHSFELTKMLLDRGLDPNRCSAPRKPLHLAADRGLVEVVRLLLDRGADVRVVDGENMTPLELVAMSRFPNREQTMSLLRAAGATENIFTAIATGDDERALAMLVDNPSLVTTRGPIWFTPLDIAARFGRARVTAALVGAGVVVDAANPARNTALWLACQSDHDATDRIAVATLLLDAGANPRRACEDGSTPLHFAAWRGPIAMVELLLRRGAREWLKDANGKLPIDYARDGVAPDKAAVVALLDRPVITDPLFKRAVVAIQSGDVATLQKLLADHPNLVHDRAVEPACYPPGYFGSPKLVWFVANNPTLVKTPPANVLDVTRVLVDAGVERDDLDYTLGLVMTSDTARTSGQQRPLMRLLLESGARATDEGVFSTLGHGERDAIQALLDSGLPLTAPIAAGMGWADELERLLATSDDAVKHASLSMAVINRQVEAVRLCLKAGADANRFMLVHTHSLPVHQAAVNDDVEALRVLVEHGAKLDVRDTLWDGTPLGWAIHTKKSAAEAYLRSIGAP